MNYDIKSRLRATRNHSDMWWVSLCEESADRIERLEGLLREARQTIAITCGCSTCGELRSRIAAELGETK